MKNHDIIDLAGSDRIDDFFPNSRPADGAAKITVREQLPIHTGLLVTECCVYVAGVFDISFNLTSKARCLVTCGQTRSRTVGFGAPDSHGDIISVHAALAVFNGNE